jgi:hypothetical protein
VPAARKPPIHAPYEPESPLAETCGRSSRSDAGSYEVRFPDGRESVYFYFDDDAGRKAKDLARAEQDKLKSAK